MNDPMLRWASCQDEAFEHYENRCAAPSANPVGGDVLSEVQVFPTQYRVPVSLHCCERYSGKGITMLVKKPAATICKYLHKARIQLRQQLGGAYDAA